MKRIFIKLLSVSLAMLALLSLSLSALLGVFAEESELADTSDVSNTNDANDAASQTEDYTLEAIITGIVVILVAVFMLALVFFGVVIMKTGVRKK